MGTAPQDDYAQDYPALLTFLDWGVIVSAAVAVVALVAVVIVLVFSLS
jgi:hypothetical protein